MEKKEYSVSEAVRLIGVESHVLRYWEEELQVKIRRTSQGHRIYSQENIDTFCKVKELKEHGLQLKAIRYLLDKTGGTEKVKLTEQIFEPVNDRESFLEKEETRQSAQGKTGGNPGGETKKVRDWEDADPVFSGKEEQLREKGRIWEEIREIFEENEELNYSEESRGDERSGRQEKGRRSPIVENEDDIVYDVAVTPISEDDFDKYAQFEEILKRIIGEIIEEKNQKVEQSLRRMLREELDQFFILYQDVASEAAAEREFPAKRGFFRHLMDFLRR